MIEIIRLKIKVSKMVIKVVSQHGLSEHGQFFWSNYLNQKLKSFYDFSSTQA